MDKEHRRNSSPLPEQETKQTILPKRDASETENSDHSLDLLTEDPSLLPSLPPQLIGKARFNWQRELSEDGRKLYLCLLEERGDRELLPIYAKGERFDLQSALSELRGHSLLDERDPQVVKMVRHTL